jgi:hypothetical protein
MIITQSTPFTPDQIEQLKQQFDVYIKTVIDIVKDLRSHYGSPHWYGIYFLKVLVKRRLGGGIDLMTESISTLLSISAPMTTTPKTKSKVKRLSPNTKS